MNKNVILKNNDLIVYLRKQAKIIIINLDFTRNFYPKIKRDKNMTTA